MKRILLTTFLAAALGASVSAMALDAPGTVSSATDRRVVGDDVVRQIDDTPRLLAAGDAWEGRSQRFSQPLSPKRSRGMQRRGVRVADPWWR